MKAGAIVGFNEKYIYIYENKTSGKNMPFPAQNHTVKGVEQNTQMKAGAIVLS
jgi:hypothetical protein